MRERRYQRFSLLAFSFLLGAGSAGCAGGHHRQHEQRLSFTGGYQTPIKGSVLYPDGAGRAESASVSVGYEYFAADRVAIQAVATPYRNHDQRDGHVTSGEFQLGVRYYFWEFDLGPIPVGLYGEILGGLMNGSQSVPEDGSNTNFTQDTGLGFEAVLTKQVSWIGGYRMKHLSNGRVFRSDSNPSQNDHFVYTGISISIR